MKRNIRNRITPEQLHKDLATRSFGRIFFSFPQVTSTNDVALYLAEGGAPEGTVVSAEIQTKGRGRQGRSWVLTEGKALAFSIVLRPKVHDDEVAKFTLAAAVGVAKAIEDYHLKPQIKWPNDLLLKGRKVCGILTEMGTKKDKISSVILGIGINLHQGAGDFPKELRKIATSLYLAGGQKPNRAAFFQRLLLRLEETFHWASEGRFQKVLAEWRKRSAVLGRQIKVHQAHHSFYGQAVDVDEKGALLVRTDQGMVERITAGDVQLLKLEVRSEELETKSLRTANL
jgi:BirA family transcriptional regulator, biotin operon repressor / biotin---[acetyl-CoA-carboxylase] ligase